MKRLLYAIFILLCVAVLVVPSVGMLVRPTTAPIGNERLSAAPSLTKEDGSFNVSYFSELGGYYEKHFAFRPEMIQADAEIQAGVFKTSNIDTVLVGRDDWLYYTSTTDDFLGKNPLSDGQMAGVVHNLAVVQRYCEANGVRFLFTVAPNKNTLYPDQMPYTYSAKVSDTRNHDTLHAQLRDSGVNYCNLFEPLAAQSETLYFARDSHWNNKGALLVYNTVLDQLGQPHEDYSAVTATRRKDFTGDLSRMLYPVDAEPEYDYDYGAQENYTYVTDTKSVEEPLISTAAPGASGKLFMYRDSFGNALLPFFASAYSSATFTKAFPMNIPQGLQSSGADTFIMELVERNINWLLTMPPMLPAAESASPQAAETTDGTVTTEVKPCTFAAEYTQITGAIDSSAIGDGAVCLVAVKDKDGVEKTFDAYNYLNEEGDGFLLYLPADQYPADSASVVKVSVNYGGSVYDVRP